MLALGTPAPGFRLTDFNGKVCTLEDFAAARGLVVAFICNHCPYVNTCATSSFRARVSAAGIAVVAICSNDTDAYPQDGPAGMAEEARNVAGRLSLPVRCDPERRQILRCRARRICTCSTGNASSSTADSSTTAVRAAARRPGKICAACDALLSGTAAPSGAEAQSRLQHQVELRFAYHR